jgi:hypothetical protein
MQQYAERPGERLKFYNTNLTANGNEDPWKDAPIVLTNAIKTRSV